MQNNHSDKQNAVPENHCGQVTLTPRNGTIIENGEFKGRTDLKDVVIPSGVTGIGDEAFFGCTSLTSIVIPDDVTYIGERAFEGCTSLASIVIPEGVISIDSRVFKDCTSLTAVIIPDSVVSINKFAFYRCTSLTAVVIPDSVVRIGASAFFGVKSIIYNGPSFYPHTGATRLIKDVQKHETTKRPTKGIRIGNSLFLGRYPQTRDDMPEPIEWQIRNVQGEDVIVVSRYMLESAPFHRFGKIDHWRESDLYKWLHEVFYNAAFTEEEREAIHSISLPDTWDLYDDFPIWYLFDGEDYIPGAGAESTPHARSEAYWTCTIRDAFDLELAGIDVAGDAVDIIYSNDDCSVEDDYSNYHGVRPVLGIKRSAISKYIKPAEEKD